MIMIEDKSKCTGCGACLVGCPTNAIEFIEDDEGVKYPRINMEKCIHCNKCSQLCPMKNEYFSVKKENLKYKASFFAARLKKMEDLKDVSSGGAFWALAQSILDNNGIVYGVQQIDIDNAKHSRCDSKETTSLLRKSKYIQSEVASSYVDVKKDLDDGKEILFTGTGCQIAGLYMYLGHDYDKLITAEVVCHGVPCGLAWKSYRKEKEKKMRKKMISVDYRDKSIGWSNNQYKITYEDGSQEFQKSTEQIFHKGYLMGLFYRPSCGKCIFSSLPRIADLTLADYWKYKGRLLENNNMGVSLIVVNNHKGLKILRQSEKYLIIDETGEEDALNSCRHLNNSPLEHGERNVFMQKLKKYGYHKAIKRYTMNNSLKENLKKMKGHLFYD